MTTAHDADPAPVVNPGLPRTTHKPAGQLGALSAIAGCAALVGSLSLPWLTVTQTVTSLASNTPEPARVTSWTAYPLLAVTNVLGPLLLPPAAALVVSTLRSLRRGAGPTGDVPALAIFGVVASLVYAFLLALASMPWFSYRPGRTISVWATPLSGLWVALAGSLLALAACSPHAG